MKQSVENLKSKLVSAITGTKKQKMKFSLAFQVEYDADPSMYTDTDPTKMGEEDTLSANSNPMLALKGMLELEGARIRVKCEPVQTVGEKAGLVVEVKS